MHLVAERFGFRTPGLFEVYYWGRISLALELIYSGEADEDRWPWIMHLHLLFVNVYLHLPCKYVPLSRREPWQGEWQRWGFSICDDALHLYWNEKSKVWWLPWFNKIHQKCVVRRADGTWVDFVGSWKLDKEPDGREELTLPYRYVLLNGTIQERQATIYVERRSWRPKWFTWTNLFERSRQSISVEFNEEVGERTGSWKGGCVGCSWEMLPGESAEQAIRRMERERKFD